MPKHHGKQKGQSKEIFKLIGGRHTRPALIGKERIVIVRGDTLHLTQKEADHFGDKFQLVQPKIATDIDLTVDDEEAVEETVVEDTDNEATTEDEEVDISKVTGMGPLDRDDFASVKAHSVWEKNGKPDLSQVARSGHSGRTYALKDVKSVL